MKKNQGSIFKLIWNFLKGIWSSFSRSIGRSLYPNRRRQPVSSNTDTRSPLVGISQFRHSESLTVSELLGNVKWQVPNSANSHKTASTSMISVKDEINWD